MSGKKKQETRFSLDSPVITVGKESTSFSDRSATKIENSILTPRKIRLDPKLLPYTPPDALMFALFSAIQHKAWIRARRLCYELILCDPSRKNYYDLYYRIDQIIKVIDQRLRPHPVASRTTTASSGSSADAKSARRKP